MKLLTKKELFTSLCIGIILGVFTGIFIISYLLSTEIPEKQGATPLNPLIIKASEKNTFSLPSPIEKVISIPTEIHMSKQKKGTIGYEMIKVRVSFYTGLARENGGYTEKNALGGPLTIGSLAAPSDIPFGSSFIIKNLPKDVQTDTFIVDDRGGAIKWMNDHTMKVDVYVKRQPGESDAAYFRRTNNLGIIYTTALYKYPN